MPWLRILKREQFQFYVSACWRLGIFCREGLRESITMIEIAVTVRLVGQVTNGIGKLHEKFHRCLTFSDV